MASQTYTYTRGDEFKRSPSPKDYLSSRGYRTSTTTAALPVLPLEQRGSGFLNISNVSTLLSNGDDCTPKSKVALINFNRRSKGSSTPSHTIHTTVGGIDHDIPLGVTEALEGQNFSRRSYNATVPNGDLNLQLTGDRSAQIVDQLLNAGYTVIVPDQDNGDGNYEPYELSNVRVSVTPDTQVDYTADGNSSKTTYFKVLRPKRKKTLPQAPQHQTRRSRSARRHTISSSRELSQVPRRRHRRLPSLPAPAPALLQWRSLVGNPAQALRNFETA